MKQPTYYTIIKGQRAYIVKYAQAPAYAVKLFSGAFADPGEASQAFKKALQGKLECIAEASFDRKVGFLSTRYKQDLARLSDWNSGKKVSI